MINLEAINSAYLKIKNHIKETPLVICEFLSNYCDGQVYLKLENQQITNSFKIRGALNKIMSLSEEEKKKGIITASSGNHAQAVGVVAEQLGISAKIVVPETTPKNKIDKIKKLDVILELFGKNYDEAEVYTRELTSKEGRTFVSAYNDKLIIAGQGTIGLEIYNDLSEVTDVLVPLGGGGLLSGIAVALKTLNPAIRIFGVQTEACPAFYESLKIGKIIDVEMKDSIADGMYGGIEQGSITFDLVREFVDEVIVVKEDTLYKAIDLFWKEEKQVIEGAAAAAIAPILENKSRFTGKTIVSIITGGNIDKELFLKIIKK